MDFKFNNTMQLKNVKNLVANNDDFINNSNYSFEDYYKKAIEIFALQGKKQFTNWMKNLPYKIKNNLYKEITLNLNNFAKEIANFKEKNNTNSNNIEKKASKFKNYSEHLSNSLKERIKNNQKNNMNKAQILEDIISDSGFLTIMQEEHMTEKELQELINIEIENPSTKNN